MTITSYIPGRIRIRDDRISCADEAEQTENLLKSLPGITRVNINMRTKSLLVQYDPASGVEELLGSYAGLSLPEASARLAQKKQTSSKKRTSCVSSAELPFSYRQILNYGMMVTFGVSAIGIAIHYKKLHALAGFLFIAIGGLHMYNKRRTLFI